MPTRGLDASLVSRLHRQAKADRWQVSAAVFTTALERSVGHAFPDALPDRRQLDRYVRGLHLEDLALACACADGHERAWDYFVREYRPVLYRAADAIDPGGGARELADSLYGDLFGLSVSGAERPSLFRYFHGRSSLATWLRAVLAQRHVDRLRSVSRLAPFPEEEPAGLPAARLPSAESTWLRYIDLMRRTVQAAIGALAPRDRLRLGCYHVQGLTLAQIGRTLGEHEATASRHLTRTRRTIREQVERTLREQEGMTPEEIDECFQAVLHDPGPLDIVELVGADVARKEVVEERST